MTGTIDIMCTVPAPTLAQVRAWLTRNGWTRLDRESVAGPAFTIPAFHGYVHNSHLAVHDSEPVDKAWMERRAASVGRPPEAVYREIVGPVKVWAAVSPWRADPIRVHATREGAERAAEACDGTVEEHEVQP